jgi:hypothetical protein
MSDEKIGPIPEYVWRAALDARPRSTYAYAHALRVEPPVHPTPRCKMIPLTDEEKQELRAKIVGPATKATVVEYDVAQLAPTVDGRRIPGRYTITLPGQIVGPVTCAGTVKLDAPRDCPCGIFRGDCEYHR